MTNENAPSAVRPNLKGHMNSMASPTRTIIINSFPARTKSPICTSGFPAWSSSSTKKTVSTLPEKRYRKVICKPTASTLRVARAIAASAPNAVTGLTLLRELSDGFQYREAKDGKTKCPHCEESCGKVYEWFDPEDEDRTFRAIDMLDEALVARLEKREVDCPRCGGTGEVDRMKRIVREVPCPKNHGTQRNLGRKRRSRPHRNFRRFYRISRSRGRHLSQRRLERCSL